MSERKIGRRPRRGDGASWPEGVTQRGESSRESVADTEIGLYGTQTQGEIAEARGGPGQGPEQESSDKTMSLDDLRKEAEKRGRDDDRGREHGGLER